MSASDPRNEIVLVVGDDGSVPADQLANLGLRPGARLLVLPIGEEAIAPSGLAGSLPDFPDIGWDDFERASDLARQDLARSGIRNRAHPTGNIR